MLSRGWWLLMEPTQDFLLCFKPVLMCACKWLYGRCCHALYMVAASRTQCVVPAAVLLPVQLTMFDTAMTPRQLEYLRRTHEPLIAKHAITQHHYDVMLQYLTDAMRSNGALVCAWMLCGRMRNWQRH